MYDKIDLQNSLHFDIRLKDCSVCQLNDAVFQACKHVKWLKATKLTEEWPWLEIEQNLMAWPWPLDYKTQQNWPCQI